MSEQAHGSGSVGILPDTFAAQCYARLKHTATGTAASCRQNAASSEQNARAPR